MKNRYLIALCAVGIHTSIGSIYAWSQIASDIKNQIPIQWNLSQITLAFSIAIFFLGLSAASMGYFVERKGPRASGMLSAILFLLALVGASFALREQCLWLLYLTYGAMGGTAIGIGYITPVSTLLKWFPDHRGLAMGMAIMGFGFGAAIEVFLLETFFPFLGIHNIVTCLWVLGIVHFVIMLCAALYLSPPQLGWNPNRASASPDRPLRRVLDLSQLRAKEAILTKRFYYLWLMLFINVSCGIALISVAKFMGKEVIHLSSLAAAVMVMLMSIFNGLGRIFWATLSDYLTRPRTFMIFFAAQFVAYYLLTRLTSPLLFQMVVMFILTCYGGGFSCTPAFIGDLFGLREAGAIHGFILTAWSLAGLTGPLLIAGLHDLLGNYNDALYVFMFILAIAFIISWLMQRNVAQLKRRHEAGAL